MQIKTQCIITGCALVSPDFMRYAWGDLHMQGKAVIFNATNGARGDRPHWIDTDWPAADKEQHERFEHFERCALLLPHDAFERRGLFVLHPSNYVERMFNSAARGRIGSTTLQYLMERQS